MRRVNQSLMFVKARPGAGRKARSGLLLAEALIASLAIGAAAVLALSMLLTVSANRRTAERTLVATQELSNQMERLTARPWTELTPELVQQVQLSSMAAARLPAGELRIRLQEVDKPRPGKRFEGELRWQDRGNSWRPPLRLTTWVFAPQEVK